MRTKPTSPRLQRGHPQAGGLALSLQMAGGTGLPLDWSGGGHHVSQIVSGNGWSAGVDGPAIDLSAPNSRINLAHPVLIPAGSDFAIAARTRIVSWRDSGNPGLFRDGSTFAIFQGATGRPWVRWAGQDVLRPGSGYSLPLSEWVDITIVVRSAVSAEMWVDGVLRHVSAHSVATSNFQIAALNQNTSSENLEAVYSNISIWRRALSSAEVSQLHHDPYAAFRPRTARRFFQRIPNPPENLTAPTLQINPDGTWTGTLGTWTNNPTNYAWELRRAADDSVVDSEAGSLPEPGGGGLLVRAYYLWVRASNSGGSAEAVSAPAWAPPAAGSLRYDLWDNRLRYDLWDNHLRFDLRVN